jgi:hypothetical protein
MKNSLLIVFGLILFSTAACFAQTTQQLYNEAQRAYLAGDVDTAKEKFKLVLEMDPKNVGAQGYLRTILTREKMSGGGELQKQLQGLILPKVEFRDATFGAALDYLKQQAAKQSVQVSIVSQLPAEFSQTQKATLNLANVPFTEALRYLCEQGNATFQIQKYAVVVKSKTAVEAAAPQASPVTTQ